MNLNKNNQPRGSIITLTDINFPQNQLNFSHSSQSSSSDTSKVTLNSKMNIQQIIPDDINNYIEPFVGGGSSFLNVKAKNYIVNDIDSSIISIHRMLKEYSPKKTVPFGHKQIP